jgi:uncharacterized membrane protein
VIALLLKHWRGDEELIRTVLAGGLATLGWTVLVWLTIFSITDSSRYSGTYELLQWLVLVLILSTAAGILWWCTGVMRCALRRQREGRSFAVSLVVFVGGLLVLLNSTAQTFGIAHEWLQGWWDTVTDRVAITEVIHDPTLGRIVVRGEIGFGSFTALDKAMQMKPKLTLVQIESPGGYVVEGLAMARLIEKNQMDTVSLGPCASACTLLLAAGQERYLGPQASVGFHRSGVFGYSPSTAWTRTDYKLADYYKSRDTSEDFIKLALDTPSNKLWIPEHQQMFAAGYATKRWDERKSGY